MECRVCGKGIVNVSFDCFELDDGTWQHYTHHMCNYCGDGEDRYTRITDSPNTGTKITMLSYGIAESG